MSNELANQIGLVLIFTSVGVLVLYAVYRTVGYFSRERSGDAELETTFDAETADAELAVHWDRHPNWSKPAIEQLAAARGWTYQRQEIYDQHWTLIFVRAGDSPADRMQQERLTDPRLIEHRLLDHLRSAAPEADGYYRLDTTPYEDTLGLRRVSDIARANGWNVEAGGREGRSAILKLARPGSAPTSTSTGFLIGLPGPGELRTHPAGAELARRFRHELGFDPLAPELVAHYRAEHRRRYRLVQRQVAIGITAGFGLLFALVLALRWVLAGESSTLIVAAAGVALVLAAVTVVATVRGVRLHRSGTAETAPFVDAYRRIASAVQRAERDRRRENPAPPMR